MAVPSSRLSFIWRDAERAPFLLRYRSSKWFIILSVAIAVFTDVFLYGAVVPVIPFALSERAGVDPNDVQYWVSILLGVYGAALLVASPCWGYLSDRISSRRSPLLIGLGVLAGATGLLCAGSSITILILGRILQGVSASLVWTIGLALIVDTVDSKDVGIAMGYVGLAMSIAILGAPLLAGIIYNTAGYYPVFAMLFALIGIDIVLRVLMVERKFAQKWIDFGAQPIVEAKENMTVVEPVTVSASNTENSPGEPQSCPALEMTPGKTRLPLSIRLLKIPRLLAALVGTLAQASLSTSFDSTLPLLVQKLFNWTSLGAGLIFIPLVLPTFLGPLIGAMGDRYGAKWLTTVGFLVALPFLVCFRFVTANEIESKVLLCAMLAGVGTAIALVFSPLMAEITWVIEAEERRLPKGTFGPGGAYARAYALFNVAFSGGTLIGPILGGLIKDKAGWGTLGWSLALLSLVAAVVAAVGVGEPLRRRRLYV